MANQRVVFIDVFIDRISPLKFRVEPSPKNNPQLPVGPKNRILFNNDHHPGFQIHFELQGNTHGYFFPPTSKKFDAIWSKLGTACPDSVEIKEVFQPLYVIDQPPTQPGQPVERRILVVDNRNPHPAQGDFQYNLRVTKDEGANYLNLDPGGGNENGPSNRFTTESMALLFGGAALTGMLSALVTVAALAKFDLACGTSSGL